MKLNFRSTSIRCLLSVSLLAVILATTSPVWGQQASGTITGTVSDPSGAAVANATVTARDVDRGTTWTTQTNSSGVYELPQVSVGKIEIRVEASGFSKQVQPPFALILNQIARVDFQLSVGQMSTTVEVTTAPPILQTDSTELGTVIETHVVTALPLATRDLKALSLLAPGVVSPIFLLFRRLKPRLERGVLM